MMGRLLLALGLFVVAGTAVAEGLERPSIRDEANMFRASTRARANEQIAEIQDLCQRDVVVETMASVPAADYAQVKAMQPAEQAKFFAKMGAERAEDAGVNGILILICRDPAVVQVTAWPESQREAFTDEDASRLEKLLRHRRFFPDLDHRLLDGLSLVRSAYVRNLHLRQPDDGATNLETMAIVLLGYVAVWLLLHFANTRSGAATVQARNESQPGLYGGRFGQAAALWIYDRLLVLTPQTEVAVIAAAPPSTDRRDANEQLAAVESDRPLEPAK